METASTTRALLTVDETAAMLGIGRSKAYAMVASGLLPSIRLGRALRVPRRKLDEWIDRETRETVTLRLGQVPA